MLRKISGVVIIMPKCSFCSGQIEQGTGKIFIENTGKTHWFCSSKCEKNTRKLGRDPRDFKWAKQNT